MNWKHARSGMVAGLLLCAATASALADDVVIKVWSRADRSGPLRAGNIVEAQKGAILAALSITDELFDAREAGEDLAGSMKRLSAEIRPWLPPAKRKD